MTISPRLQRMMKSQAAGSLLLVVIITISCFMVIKNFLGINAEAVILASALSFILSKIGMIIVSRFFQTWFYRDDYVQMLNDINEAQKYFESKALRIKSKWSHEKVKFQIINYSPQIGTYQDAPIFEWIEILGCDGSLHRCSFHGTVDLKKLDRNPIPENCILYDPGLIYQVNK